MQNKLILASGSPRRKELLTLMGISFQVCAVDVDENLDGAPDEVVKALALRKAQAAYRLHPGETVLAADTLVYKDGKTLGKPKDEADALRMLLHLSGGTNTVYTGVCIIDGVTGREEVCCDAAYVRFVDIDEASARRYIQSGEPMDKAGAYGVQGMGGMFVSSVEGSPSNVIGLPMHLVRRMLRNINWQI